MKCCSSGFVFGEVPSFFVFNEQRTYFSLLGENQISTLPAGMHISGSGMCERALVKCSILMLTRVREAG